MNQPDKTEGLNSLRELIRTEIKYRVNEEYQKYHNALTFEHNGVDYWKEQIEVKLSDTFTSAILHWIDREVIGEEFSAPMSENMVWMLNHDERIKTRNELRAEQRTILTQHGYKGGK